MAEVSLQVVWLHAAADLADVLEVDMVSCTETVGSAVQVRAYAGGRRRLIVSPGSVESLRFATPELDRATWDGLRRRVGVLQMLRDPRGRKWWGVIASVDGDEDVAEDLVRRASFVFERVTVTEEV